LKELISEKERISKRVFDEMKLGRLRLINKTRTIKYKTKYFFLKEKQNKDIFWIFNIIIFLIDVQLVTLKCSSYL